MLSTFITHPFDIIRTHIQVRISQNKELSIAKQFIHLIKSGKLFDGVAPRLIKKPLSNTLAFLLF